MALYHAHTAYLSRGSKSSACSHAAYITAEKVTEKRTDMSFDYRSKIEEVSYKNILVPEGMEHLDTTDKLWNYVEEYEDKIAEERYGNYKDPEKQAKSLAAKERFLANAAIAFKMECSLPIEMSFEEKKELADRIAKGVFVDKNLIVQYAIHDIKDNPHVHFVSNFRPVIDGKFSNRKVYFLSSDIKEIRKQLADITNEYAAERGYEFSIDHRSYKDQGLKIEPTKHLGWWAKKLAHESRVVLENREIISHNTELLLNSPEELIKLLIQNKTVFTLKELKQSIGEKFKDDPQAIHILEQGIKGKNIEKLIDRAELFGEFLTVANTIKSDALAAENESDAHDTPSLVELREERSLLAEKILDNIEDYRWLMGRVGMSENILELMSSKSVYWHDKAEFLGANVPQGLKAGDCLHSLERSIGQNRLDGSLVEIFNLENLGGYFRGQEAYIASQDLIIEQEILQSKESLSQMRFGSKVSLVNKVLDRKLEDILVKVIESQEKKQGYEFSSEQKDAAFGLIEDSAYTALVGRAGTGKTTTLRSVAATYKKGGFRVIGTSFQGAAVGELSDSLGKYMDGGYTLSKLNKEWGLIDKGQSSGARSVHYELTNKTVVIIDEAAMASRGLLKPLLDRAKEKESKVIFVGDPAQIAAIDRGDIGRLLFDGAHSLEQVIRQNNIEDRKASRYLSEGYIKSALDSYIERNQVNIKESAFASKLCLAHDYAEKSREENHLDHLAMAFRRSDVDDLNQCIQRIRQENGEIKNKFVVLTGYSQMKKQDMAELLSNDDILSSLAQLREKNIVPFKSGSISYKEAQNLLNTVDKEGAAHQSLSNLLKPKEFYPGDKIRFTSNWNEGVIGDEIFNGTLGIIKSHKNNEIEVEGSNGKTSWVDLSKYQDLDLGYALTINSSQGKTAENSYIYLHNSKNASVGAKEIYVAATRHREEASFYSSNEYLGEKSLDQKIIERGRIMATDLKHSEEFQQIHTLDRLNETKHSLWSEMQKDIRQGYSNLWDHPRIGEYKELSDNIKYIAGKVADNWDKARLYAGQIKMSLQDVERMQGGEIELSEDAKKIEQYRELKGRTKEMWQDILSTKSNLPASEHEKYKVFADMVNKRDELAYELASFGSHKEIHDKDGNLVKANNYNHLEKSEWKTILSHSNLHIEKQVKTDVYAEELQRGKDIEYIKQYKLLDKRQEKALSSVQAKEQKDSLKASESYIEKNKQVVSDILKLDPSVDKTSLVADLSKNSQSKIQAILHLRTVRDESIRENIGKVIDEFAKNKQSASSIDKLIPVVKDEQKYLSGISGNLQDKNIKSYGKDIVPIVKAALSAASSSDSLNKMVSLIEDHKRAKHFTQEKVVFDLRKDNNIQEAIKQINSDIVVAQFV